MKNLLLLKKEVGLLQLETYKDFRGVLHVAARKDFILAALGKRTNFSIFAEYAVKPVHTYLMNRIDFF